MMTKNDAKTKLTVSHLAMSNLISDEIDSESQRQTETGGLCNDSITASVIVARLYREHVKMVDEATNTDEMKHAVSLQDEMCEVMEHAGVAVFIEQFTPAFNELVAQDED